MRLYGQLVLFQLPVERRAADAQQVSGDGPVALGVVERIHDRAPLQFHQWDDGSVLPRHRHRWCVGLRSTNFGFLGAGPGGGRRREVLRLLLQQVIL